METYHAYIERHSRAIRKLMVETKCQPVLFIGSGMTKRYAGGPNWMELLKGVATEAGLSSDDFNYLAQISDNNPARIGTNLAEKVHFWAWHKARERFPEPYFLQGVDRSIFLKFIVTEILAKYKFREGNKNISEEIKLLASIYPHAVITTNFDQMVEKIYPNHELIVGERIIPLSMNITGELYKIHGTISDPHSLVLTEQDYERFSKKRKYISSKMMTYFAEYPVFILGYGLGDSNVNSILSDLGEAIRDKGGLLENVYYISWSEQADITDDRPDEYVIPVDQGNQPPLRVKMVKTSGFEWLYQILADTSPPVPMNPKHLRHLAARVIDLIRTDIPRNNVEIDYTKVEHLSENANQLALVLGISNVTNSNLDHPFTITVAAEHLGLRGWNGIKPFIDKANSIVGYDIRASDNEYHTKIKTGKSESSFTRKYSAAFIRLIRRVMSEGA